MTLCIAALCSEPMTPCVVVAYDKRIETDIASAEIGTKFLYLTDFWSALVAGPVSQAQELANIYGRYLAENEIGLDSVIEQLRIPTRTLRRRLADSLTHKRVSLSYEAFLDEGKEKLAPDLYSQLAYEISQQSVEAELILIGVIEQQFCLFLCRGGEVTQVYDFAVIGSGSMVAEPILYQRELHPLDSLEKTLYVVYEAKKLGEISPSVGRETRMRVGVLHTVFDENTEECTVAHLSWHINMGPALLESLDKAFKEFGPRPIEGLQLPVDGLLSTYPACSTNNEKEDDSGSAESGGGKAAGAD